MSKISRVTSRPFFCVKIDFGVIAKISLAGPPIGLFLTFLISYGEYIIEGLHSGFHMFYLIDDTLSFFFSFFLFGLPFSYIFGIIPAIITAFAACFIKCNLPKLQQRISAALPTGALATLLSSHVCWWPFKHDVFFELILGGLTAAICVALFARPHGPAAIPDGATVV